MARKGKSEAAWSGGEPIEGLPAEGAARKDAPETSKWAAKAIAPSIESQAGRILAAIREAPAGLTDDEGELLLTIGPSSYTPRRGELYRAGYIRRSGERRLTRGGRLADVWVAADLTDRRESVQGAA